MTLVLLFDAHAPGDAALANSHWMAERTRERLGDVATMLTHPDAVRSRLESSLDDPQIRGLAVFGHGDAGRLHTALRMQHRRGMRAALAESSEAGAVYGSDGEPALDADNLHVLRGRFCHAMACQVGLSLAHRATDRGAGCFVAYETSLTPEYDADTLPSPLRDHLATLVTTTTFHLNAGLHDEIALKARVQEAVIALEAWLEEEDGAAWIDGQEGYMQVAGIRGLARQLWRDMVVLLGERSA